MNEAYAKIGQRVKSFRKERGFSQDELAEGICSRQTISLLENGQHFPSAEFMQKIAERLGVPFHEIMVDEASEFEAKVQIDIIKVYIETREFDHALELIDQLERVEDLLEYQRRELVFCRADCYIKSGDAQSGIDCLTELQQKLEQLREPDDILMAQLYDKLGTAEYFLAKYSKSYAHYMRAYQLSLRFPKFDLTAARITYNLGMVCRLTNNTVEAIEFLTKAEAYFNSVTDLRLLANATFELGIAYKDRNDYEKADKYLSEALVLYNSLSVFGMARRVKQTYALRVLSKKEPKRAVEELINCFEEFLEVGDTTRASVTLASIAEIYVYDKKFMEASKYITHALSLFTRDDAKSNPIFAFVYQVYSKYLLNIKEFEKCIEFSYESSEIFYRMGLERDAADSLKIVAQLYREKGMFEKVDEVSQRIIELLTYSQDRFATRMEVL